jgi:DNA processing protein
MEEHRALLSMARCWLRADGVRRLLEAHGSATAALEAGPGAWLAAGLAEADWAQASARDPATSDADARWLEHPAHHVLGWHDPDYPALLRRIPDPPAVLFVVGNVDLLWYPQVAIVGSRLASPAGCDNARAFARQFASAGWAVTSGLAAGIDARAHLGALDAGGTTIAVVGCGPGRVFPMANRALSARIEATGAIVSEYPPGVGPRAAFFPQRNRVIAGLALATVVVEAAERSGALITARLAADAGREVCALPGSIHNPMARGCHRLIRQGAALVESPEEVIVAAAAMAAVLGDALRGRLEAPAAPAATTERTGNSGDNDTNRVLQALGHDPVNLDQLASRSGLTVANLASMLLAMELDGRVIAENGRYVRRT